MLQPSINPKLIIMSSLLLTLSFVENCPMQATKYLSHSFMHTKCWRVSAQFSARKSEFWIMSPIKCLIANDIESFQCHIPYISLRKMLIFIDMKYFCSFCCIHCLTIFVVFGNWRSLGCFWKMVDLPNIFVFIVYRLTIFQLIDDNIFWWILSTSKVSLPTMFSSALPKSLLFPAIEDCCHLTVKFALTKSTKQTQGIQKFLHCGWNSVFNKKLSFWHQNKVKSSENSISTPKQPNSPQNSDHSGSNHFLNFLTLLPCRQFSCGQHAPASFKAKNKTSLVIVNSTPSYFEPMIDREFQKRQQRCQSLKHSRPF